MPEFRQRTSNVPATYQQRTSNGPATSSNVPAKLQQRTGNQLEGLVSRTQCSMRSGLTCAPWRRQVAKPQIGTLPLQLGAFERPGRVAAECHIIDWMELLCACVLCLCARWARWLIDGCSVHERSVVDSEHGRFWVIVGDFEQQSLKL